MSEASAPRRRLWIGGVLVLLLAVVAAVVLYGRSGGSDQGGDKTTLIVGDQRGGVQSLLEAAGELDNVPYHIEWALFPAASPLLEALNSGAVDIGGVGGPPFAFAYAGGAPIKVVFATRAVSGHGSKASAIVVSAKSPIRTWSDLKGKKLATVRGSAGQDLALTLFEKHGLKPNDVQWVYLSNSEAKAALETGSADAWSSWGAYIGYAVLRDKARVLGDARELPAQAAFYAASDKAIAGKREQIQDFVNRLGRARIWVQSHRKEWAESLSRETGLPVDVAHYYIDDIQSRPVAIDATVEREQTQILERFRKVGLIEKVPSLNGAFDPSFKLSEAKP
jgi:sulfonate transport system substrate-binding protein